MITDNQAAPQSNTEQPQGGSMADAAAQTPQAQAAQPQNQPAQNQVQNQPNQSAAPNQPNQANPPMTPRTPEEFHQNAFKSIFETLAGGPRYKMTEERDQAGNPTGKQIAVRVPQSKKSLAAGILAGALSSMAAGYAAPDAYNKNGTRDFSPSAQAGLKVGQEEAANRGVQGAKKLSDAEQSRAYTAFKLNLDQWKSSTDAGVLQDKTMQDKVDNESAIYSAALENGLTPDPNESNLSGADVQKLLSDGSKHVTRDMVLATGSKEMTDADGKPVMIPGTNVPQKEILYSVIDPHSAAVVTQDLKDKFGMLQNVPDGQTVPLRALLTLAKERHNIVSSQQVIDDMVKRHNDAFPDSKVKDVSVQDLLKKDPSLRSALPYLATHYGQDPDQMFAELEQKGVAAPELAKALMPEGRDVWANRRDQAKKEAERNADPDKRPIGQEMQDGFADKLQKAYTNLTPAQIEIYKQDLGSDPTIKNYRDLMSKASQEDDKAKTREATNLGDGDIDALSDQLLQPDNLTAMKDIGGKGAMKGRILAEAAKKAKAQGIPFDIGRINHRIQYLNEYEDPKGRAATNRSAINNIAQHAGDLATLNDQFRRTQMKIVNTPLNKIREQFGSQIYSQYETADTVLKDELSLYFAGGYAPSKEQQTVWDKIQSGEAPPSATEAFAKEVLHLASRRADTFAEQFKKNMGFDDPNLITPAAREAARKLGMEHEFDRFQSGGSYFDKNQNEKPQANPALDKFRQTFKFKNGASPVGKVYVLPNGNISAWDGKSAQYADTGVPAAQYQQADQH